MYTITIVAGLWDTRTVIAGWAILSVCDYYTNVNKHRADVMLLWSISYTRVSNIGNYIRTYTCFCHPVFIQFCTLLRCYIINQIRSEHKETDTPHAFHISIQTFKFYIQISFD